MQNLPGGPVVGKTVGVRASTLNSHARRGRRLSTQATGPATLTALRGRQHGHLSPAVVFMTPGIPGRSGRGLGGIPPPKLFCRAGIHERPPVTAGGDMRVSPARQRGPLLGAGGRRWAPGQGWGQRLTASGKPFCFADSYVTKRVALTRFSLSSWPLEGIAPGCSSHQEGVRGV